MTFPPIDRADPLGVHPDTVERRSTSVATYTAAPGARQAARTTARSGDRGSATAVL